MFGINAPPTGLIAVTNLDPTSESLGQGYSEAVQTFAGEDAATERFREFVSRLSILPTSEASLTGLIRRLLRGP